MKLFLRYIMIFLVLQATDFCLLRNFFNLHLVYKFILPIGPIGT